MEGERGFRFKYNTNKICLRDKNTWVLHQARFTFVLPYWNPLTPLQGVICADPIETEARASLEAVWGLFRKCNEGRKGNTKW